MNKKHRIKIDTSYVDDVISGNKSFEIRFNDRDYKEGDLLEMEEVGEFGHPKRNIWAEIGYLTTFEQKDGWVVFSLIKVIAF